jgi:hypothetical protein
MRLLEALRNAVQRIEAEIADSQLFDHMGDRGEFREQIVERFLRPYLPQCYGLGSGAAFAADGTGSRQLDVILYDSVFSNVLFVDSTNSLFPVESIFGVIEVKSNLTSAELEISLDNIKSLKKLVRQPSDMLDFLPYRRIEAGTGLTYDRRHRNPYLGVCFALDGIKGESVLEMLNNRLDISPTEREMMPNFVFNFRKGYFIFRCSQQANGLLSPTPVGLPFDTFVLALSGRDTLPLFFFTVNICLNNIILRAADLNSYWAQLVRDAGLRTSSPSQPHS